MRPHCTSPEFVESLAAFVESFAAKRRREQYIADRDRQIRAEIVWCHREIKRLEREARRRPSVHRQIAELTHQIRHKELELAFLEEQ